MSGEKLSDEKYFQNITTRERAIFEGAITMGALFHQFVGTPVSIDSAPSLEKAIEESLTLQPCISNVKVRIDREMLEKAENEYEYLSLTGDMLDVKVTSGYPETRVVVRMHYIEELQYPLMYVEEVD
jgi:dihydroneopterin aldolase